MKNGIRNKCKNNESKKKKTFFYHFLYQREGTPCAAGTSHWQTGSALIFMIKFKFTPSYTIPPRERAMNLVFASSAVFIIATVSYFLNSSKDNSVVFRKSVLLRHDLKHDDNNCNSNTWGVFRPLISNDLDQAIDRICQKLLEGDRLLHSESRPPKHPIYYRFRVIQSLLGTDASPADTAAFSNFFAAVVKDTRVHILIGSRNRAAPLSIVLQLLAEYHSKHFPLRVSISYDASEDVHEKAYNALAKDFPSYEFIKRSKEIVGEKQYPYGNFIRDMVSSSSATNFVILSDDTYSRKKASLQTIGALQRILSTVSVDSVASIKPYVVVAEQRGRVGLPSMPSENGAVFVPELGPWNDLPGMVLYNTSNCEMFKRGGKPRGAHELCYNRHIDGPMYTKECTASEFSALPWQSIRHPANLEGHWIELRDSLLAAKDDFSLAPASQIFFNGGMRFVSAREDPWMPLVPNETYHLRTALSAAIVAGCRQNPLAPEVIAWMLETNDFHRLGYPLPWNCPPGIDPPSDVYGTL